MRKKIQKILKPYPVLYKIGEKTYAIYQNTVFFFHALISGKLWVRYDSRRFSGFLSRQRVLEYKIDDGEVRSVDDFRSWLKANNILFTEGGWTIYIPPQETLDQHFSFLKANYTVNAGIKILKDFRSPGKARYTNHSQNPAPGNSLKRLLTPSPKALVRVANYLYANDLGMRVYDIIHLQGKWNSYTAYVVEHFGGSEATQKEYDIFMERMKRVLDRGEITTIHKNINIMWDFVPPDCKGNLLLRREERSPVYVDFQGFILRDEKELIKSISAGIKDTVHFGHTRFFRGGKNYLYQSIPGLTGGKRDIEYRWSMFEEMFEEAGVTLADRIVMDVGCNTGLMLYNSLSEGALWGYGWDMPEVVQSAEKLLLALGATRFSFQGGALSGSTDFSAALDERYRLKSNGFLFYLAISDHIGFPDGIADLPWEYMLYEGHADQNSEGTMRIFKQVSWLKDSEVISTRFFADGDTPKRPVLLVRRARSKNNSDYH